MVKKTSPFVIASLSMLMAGSSLLSPLITEPQSARAVSDVVRPDGDIQTDWTNCTNSCTNHYTEIDESTGYDGTDYANAGGSASDGDLEHFSMGEVAGSTVNVTQVDVKVYSWINGACQGTGGNCDTLTVNISIDGSTTNSNEGAQTYTLGTTTDDNQTFSFTPTTSWTGDDDLQVILTHNVIGGGPGASRDDDVFLAYLDATVSFDVNIDQEHFRWRDDSTALNTDGGWLAAVDTKPASTDTLKGDVLRLRVEIDNSGTAGTANVGYRLQWADKGGGACSAATGWTRLDTASDDWEMTASTQYADGDALSTSRLTGGEPTFVNGYGLDTDTSGDDQSAAVQLDPDDYTEIEWAIKATASATEGGSYCFRVVDDSGGTLNAYNVYPEVTLYQSLTYPLITQEGYIFENDDGASVDVNTQQAGSEFSTGKTLTSVKKGERINLRMHLDNTGGAIDVSDQLALFYDRNDGIWSKVSDVPPETGGGDCSNSTNWECTTVASSMALGTSLAYDSSGMPWVSFENNASDIVVASFVGSGGTGCTSTAWSCAIVAASDANIDYMGPTSLVFDSNGKAWLTFRSFDGSTSDYTLHSAEYVGSGGTGCNLSSWNCNDVEQSTTATMGSSHSISIDAAGNPWIAYYDSVSTALGVAEYVGTGGSNCQIQAWNCETVDNTATVGAANSISFKGGGVTPVVSYYDSTNASLRYAVRDGATSGNCTDTDWNCEEIEDLGSGNIGKFTSIAVAPDDRAWISYYDENSTALKVAESVASGGSGCTGADNSSLWNCTTVDNTDATGLNTSLAFSPDGNPWVSYGSDTDETLISARYVESGGSGCTSTAWTCTSIDGGGTLSGRDSSIAFDHHGRAGLAHRDNGSLVYAELKRRAELVVANSIGGENGDSITESHADMTSTSDTTQRDDTGNARCITASTNWNNGVYSESENLTGLSVANGELSDPECTEIGWTIDTSQAVEGTTYRFVVATKDGFRSDKGPWRGPISVATDGYPTLTIEANTDIRYSKDTIATGTDCTDTDWTCWTVSSTGNDGQDSSSVVDPSGNIWVAFTDDGANISVAKYVGTGGDCNDTAWECTVVEDTGDTFAIPSIAASSSGDIWIAYQNDTSNDLRIARYVGSGGNCTSTEWDCGTIESTTGPGVEADFAFDKAGNPWIAHFNSGNDDLHVSRYIGNGGGNCEDDANWECTVIETHGTLVLGDEPVIAADNNGRMWVVYEEGSPATDINVAQYVGSGGTGCNGGNTEWSCSSLVDTNGPARPYLEIGPDNNPIVSYYLVTGGDLAIAEYVGSGGSGCATGVTDWNCTTLDDSNTKGDYSSIAFDSAGQPWIAYRDHTADALRIAKKVGSGGSGCATGITDWSCSNIQTAGQDTARHTSILFDDSGVPWISWHDGDDATIGELEVSKMKLPPNPPSTDAQLDYDGKNAHTGDLRYRFDNEGYSDVASDDNTDRDFNVAVKSERPIFTFTAEFTNNKYLPQISWNGQSTVSFGTNNAVMQVYRFGTTNDWETISTLTSGAADTDFTISTIVSGAASEFYEDQGGGEYAAYFRVWQQSHTSTQTLKTDSITITQIGPGHLHQIGYIIENDDGSTADGNTQQGGGNTEITAKKGERLNIRFNVDNTSQLAHSSESSFAIFYDRSDDLWSKVSDSNPNYGPSASEDCYQFDSVATATEGTLFDCTRVFAGDTASDVKQARLAISPSGTIWAALHSNESTGGDDLIIARYVGTGGNCQGYDGAGGSNEWNCETVYNGAESGDIEGGLAFGFNDLDIPTVVFKDSETGSSDVVLATYVGSNGDCDTYNDGGSDAWECTKIFDGNHINDADQISYISDSTSQYIAFSNYDTTDIANDVVVANYVGSDGNCDTFEGAGASDAWDCTVIYDTDGAENDVQYRIGIALDDSSNPWISFQDEESSKSNLVVANYVGGTSGSCSGFDDTGGSALWDCTTVFTGDDVDDIRAADLGASPDGTMWVAFFDEESLDGTLVTAEYVGSGGDCDDTINFDGGSDAWDCERVFDGADLTDVQDPSLVFGPNGLPWLAFRNADGTDREIRMGQYVGSGGNCGVQEDGGSALWDCPIMAGGNDTGDAVAKDFVFDSSGRAIIAYSDDETNRDLVIARYLPSSEITMSPSLSAADEDTISESHADMASASDATERDTSDCITGGAVWNNGSVIEGEEGSQAIPKGNTTTQCTELQFTVDTSQATEGTTYRLILASKDSWRADKGPWRGMSSISQYATITIEAATDIRYSKDNQYSPATDCFTYSEVFGGDTSWGCEPVYDGADVTDGEFSDVEFDSGGTAWVAFYDDSGAAGDVIIAEYVGSGGDCDDTGQFDGGSDAWDCTRVFDGADFADGRQVELEIAPDGSKYLAFFDDEGSADDYIVAEYVGSDGDCDDTGQFDGGSDAWDCTRVFDGGDDETSPFIGLELDKTFTPWIYFEDEETSDALVTAKYVGSGGDCDDTGQFDGGSDAWDCTRVIESDGEGLDIDGASMVIDHDGIPWVFVKDDEAAGDRLISAKYVGSGGNCDGFMGAGGSDEWTCEAVFDGADTADVPQHIESAVDSTNSVWVSFVDSETGFGDLVTAKYVGSGGDCDDTGQFDGGSDAWDCTRLYEGDDLVDGYESDIAIDSTGNPVLSFVNENVSSWELIVARYVGGSGGSCTDTAWQCDVIYRGNDNDDVGNTSIKADYSGVLWVSFRNEEPSSTFDSLVIAKQYLPQTRLGSDKGGPQLPSGDLRYRMDDGRSPQTDSPGDCGASASNQGYCGVFDNQGDYDSISTLTNQRPIMAGAVKFKSNSRLPTVYWEGRSTLAPSTAGSDGNIGLYVYRFGTTNNWELVASDSTSTNCNTQDCILSGQPSGTVTEYFEADGSEYWIYFMIYQIPDGSAITFKVDKFAVSETSQQLRGGRVFENSVKKPLLTE